MLKHMEGSHRFRAPKRSAWRMLAAALEPLESRCLLSTLAIATAADAYVRGGVSADINFGQASSLQVKKTANPVGNNNRDVYLKFDISSFSGKIGSAKLQLYGHLNTIDSVPVTAYPTSNASWNEPTIDYNNKPAPASTALATANVISTASSWYEWDVSAYVQRQQAAGQKVVSFALRGKKSSAAFAQFAAVEAGQNAPRLVVNAAVANPPPATTGLTLTATSNGTAHRAFLTWNAVDGATSYTVQRRAHGAADWQTVAASLQGTSYTDNGLTQATSYDYQVLATGTNVSLTSAPVQFTTDSIHVIEDIAQFGKPRLAFRAVIEGNAIGKKVDTIDQATINRFADRSIAANADLIFDLEGPQYTWDSREIPLAEVQKHVARIKQAVDWAHERFAAKGRTDLKVSIWGLQLPGGQTDDPAQLQAYQDALNNIAPLAQAVDYLAPCAYSLDTDVSQYLKNNAHMYEEAMYWNKPVHAYIWPDFMEWTDTVDPIHSQVPVDYWKLVLDLSSVSGDGPVIWRPMEHVWDPSDPWWQAVKDYTTTIPAAVPAVPSALAVTSTGLHLTWNDNSNNESGFVVERSANGGAYHVIGGTVANGRSWTDDDFKRGNSYSYRVRALNAKGFSSYSENVTVADPSFDGLALIRVNNADKLVTFQPNRTVVTNVTDGGYAEFDNVVFSEAADRITIKLALAAKDNVFGNRLDIYVDGLDPTNLVGHLSPKSTPNGYLSYITQSTRLDNAITAGTHTIYVKSFSNGGNLYWMRFGNSSAAPAGPRDLSASSQKGKVVLNWTKWSTDETGFAIERSSDGVTFSPLTTVGPGVTTYTDSTVNGSGKFWYRVFAVNGSSYSERSNIDIGVATAREDPWIVGKSYDDQYGLMPWYDTKAVKYIDSGDWIRYRAVRLEGMNTITIRLATPNTVGNVEVWIDSLGPAGKKIATLKIHKTENDGGYSIFGWQSTNLTPTSGYHDLYLKFTAGSYGLADMESFQLKP